MPSSKQVEVVLLVEDYKDLREQFGDILQAAGYQVVEVSGGSEALAILRSKKTQPNVMVLDCHMPDMQGWDVVRAIHEAQIKSFPIIVTSGVAPPANKFPAGSIFQFLEKPIKEEILLEAIAAALQKPTRQ